MKKKPLISVIIPFYNEEKYLDFCLASLLVQSYKPFEIVAIDDGSSDRSARIVKKYPVKLIQKKHEGPGSAKNLGVLRAKGDIVVFADADMKYDKDYIQQLIKPILDGKAIGTFVKEEYVANKDNTWSQCWNINSGLPIHRRLPEDYPDKENAFRAIIKEYFLKNKGYSTNEGYTD